MVIPVDYAQVNFRFTGAGAPSGAEVTMGLKVDTYAGSPADAATDLYGVWNATWKQVQTNAVALTEVLVKFGPDATGPSGTASGSTTGSITSTGASPAVSLLVQKVTAVGGRAGRGRCFMPGMSEADVSVSGVVDAAYLAVAVTEWNDFLTLCGTGLLYPALLHGASSPITSPTAITGLIPQAIVATQRRRQRR